MRLDLIQLKHYVAREIVRYGEFQRLITEDLFRYQGRQGVFAFLKAWHREAGFRITLLTRLTRFLRRQNWSRFGLYHVVSLFQRLQGTRHSVFLDPEGQIGGGLFIPHAFCIIVNRQAILGKNCNLAQGVTIGVSNRGPRSGTPIIGDRVLIGPGSVIIGAVKIGSDSAIGANCVVTKDVPKFGVIVGVPGKLISKDGSIGYINQVLDEDGQ